MKHLLSVLENYLPKLITAVIILVVGLLLIKLVLRLLKKALQKSKIDVTMHKFIHTSCKIVLLILLMIIVLSTVGVEMTSIVALFSVLGLAVSLAVKDSLANAAGGIILLFSKPFELGDYVMVDGVEGNVAHINVLHTKINTVDNKAIYIPNGLISDGQIINYTREEKRRLDLDIPISYSDDFKLAEQLILKILEEHPLALNQEKEPIVRIGAFADSSVNIVVRVWVKNDDYWTLKYDLLEGIKEQFDQNGISIPFNQIDVHLSQINNAH